MAQSADEASPAPIARVGIEQTPVPMTQSVDEASPAPIAQVANEQLSTPMPQCADGKESPLLTAELFDSRAAKL